MADVRKVLKQQLKMDIKLAKKANPFIEAQMLSGSSPAVYLCTAAARSC